MAAPHRACLVVLAATSISLGCVRGADVVTSNAAPPPTAPSAVGPAAWERLEQSLPGAWQMETKNGPFVVSYRLVSSGSALVESWGAGGAHETVTMFYPDHAELLLTHYCAQGNQPRLRAVSASADGVSFRFVDATNVLPGQAMLVERTLRFEGGDGFEDTEVYRQPAGGEERTVYRFRRIAP